AETAARYRYVKPSVDESQRLEIVEGRHPVVERSLAAGSFVPNDARLTGRDPQIILLTGPNMAGKSTYLRQVALIVILAQTGSFVPAASAHVGIVDQIFTRIGAADRLTQGESTFMVEMLETARILHQATLRSLLILDEIGRGTSTFDGISIAWAAVEYLHGLRNPDQHGPKVLFATHYFELTALADTLPGVSNYNLAVREWTGAGGKRELVFLRKVQPGAADRSYWIHVAQLAGLPAPVIARAQQLLQELESASRRQQHEDAMRRTAQAPAPVQPGLWEGEHPLVADLADLDVNRLTPLEALERLTAWKQRWAR
ncbi:MAG: DNA mismatch repair protein MutS, partial [Elusimicrobia bacterium]|nr:DNA mismatch repair protein MutS [Elusimicrobiota bacterium]